MIIRTFKFKQGSTKHMTDYMGHNARQEIVNTSRLQLLCHVVIVCSGVPATKILEMFGETFFDFCEESGYDRILHVLGGKLSEFLCNLDALHDHLGSIYPGMRAPSFRVTNRDGAIILHYYSVRDGLEHIVLGIVKTVARKLLKTEVSKISYAIIFFRIWDVL